MNEIDKAQKRFPMSNLKQEIQKIKEELSCEEFSEDELDGEKLPTKAEITRWVDDVMNDIFLGRLYHKVTFWNINIPWSYPGVLQIITQHPKKWVPLHKMLNRINSSCRFDFWAMVFKNRDKIPQDELLQVWYDCLNDTGSISHQKILNKDHELEFYDENMLDTTKLAASVLTNPLLIDDPIVSHRYCQVQKPGWRLLQYIHGRRHNKLNMPEALRQAIRDDIVPAFAIHLGMTGRHISFSLLVEVLENKAVSIFRHLLENNLLNDNIIPLPELCCYLAAWFHDDISVPMLAILDELYPGLIKGVKDIFGRNLLWYAVQNMKTAWFHPDCQLTPFLLEHGCDPQNENQLGLTWQAVTDGLTQNWKIKMMRRRHNLERYTFPSPKLQLSQPLDKLVKGAMHH